MTKYIGVLSALCLCGTLWAAPQRLTRGIDPTIAVHDFQALAEEHILGVSQTLSVLAQTQEVKSGNFTKMRELLGGLRHAGVPANAIWFATPDGNYSTVEGGATGQSLRDRPYFASLTNGKSVIGALVISRSTGKRSIVIAEPVHSGSQLVGAIGVSLAADELSNRLQAQMRLPPDMVFYALDANGQTALHRDPSLMFEYPSDLGDQSLRSAVHEMMSQDSGTSHYQFRGVSKTVIFERSPRLGWVFVLGFEDKK